MRAPARACTASGPLASAGRRLTLQTPGAPAFLDLTEEVRSLVAASGVLEGLVLVHSLHTTAAVVLNENEGGLLADAGVLLERLAPRGASYRHDDLEHRTENLNPGERPNGHAHLRHLLLGAGCVLPVADGEPVLGPWQRVFLVELDGERTRQVQIQALGVGGAP
ncbi:MAG: YjbQ family protein [Planctomycetes bacterium]|nr:YjbQ family protein [Planctomycetota bacterium]